MRKVYFSGELKAPLSFVSEWGNNIFCCSNQLTESSEQHAICKSIILLAFCYCWVLKSKQRSLQRTWHSSATACFGVLMFPAKPSESIIFVNMTFHWRGKKIKQPSSLQEVPSVCRFKVNSCEDVLPARKARLHRGFHRCSNMLGNLFSDWQRHTARACISFFLFKTADV